MANPDEVCGVCEETRENHGDKNHEFNAEGVLIPKKKAPDKAPDAPKPPPPPSTQADVKHIQDSFATLVEVLAEKEILSPHDIVRIFNPSR